MEYDDFKKNQTFDKSAKSKLVPKNIMADLFKMDD